MEEILKYIIENLVENKDDIVITSEKESEKVTILKVKVNKDDMGRVIGKNGKIASSIRTLIRSISSKEKIHYIVKIEEN